MATHDNVIDFTAYKMRSTIEYLDKQGRTDYAMAMQEALDAYVLGEIDIGFKDGWPYVLDIIEDISL